MACRDGSEIRYIDSHERLGRRKNRESRDFVSRSCNIEQSQLVEKIIKSIPDGFQTLLKKIIRAVVISRPLHVIPFICNYLDAELTQKTLKDMECACRLMKCM